MVAAVACWSTRRVGRAHSQGEEEQEQGEMGRWGWVEARGERGEFGTDVRGVARASSSLVRGGELALLYKPVGSHRGVGLEKRRAHARAHAELTHELPRTSSRTSSRTSLL